jgi:DNA-binding LacI/PurR family transcriptional regulator
MSQYRLSLSTVKRALDEIVREGLAEARPGKGFFVADASKPPTRKKLVFTLLSFRATLSSIADRPTGWMAGLLNAQHDFDFLMRIESVNAFAEMEARLLTRRMNADGMILRYLTGRAEQLVRVMNEIHFPYAVLDMPVVRSDVSAVVLDHEAGAFDATSHLIRLGHKRIAYVGGAPGDDAAHAWFTAKYHGYRRALKAAGLEARPEDLYLIENFDETKNRYYLPRVLNNVLLPRRGQVTAAFISTETLARAALRALIEAGVRVPQDLSLIGFNDSHADEPDFPKLTTFGMPLETAGYETVRLLVDQIENPEGAPRQRVLHGHLVVGQTVAPITNPQINP